jgi:hypothetical protein
MDDIMRKELHALYFEVKHDIKQRSVSIASGEREGGGKIILFMESFLE